MTCLIDTNVLSEFTKRKPNAGVLAWWKKNKDESLFYISAVTIGEIQYGISRLEPNSAKRIRLEKWLAEDVIEQFASRIIPYTPDIAVIWGQITAVADSEGTTKPDLDMQIAATALKHNLTVVTRNVEDMQVPNMKIFNPFTDA